MEIEILVNNHKEILRIFVKNKELIVLKDDLEVTLSDEEYAKVWDCLSYLNFLLAIV